MKLKQGFRLRSVGNEKVVIAEGVENIDFGKIISMNPSAAWLWEQIDKGGKVFSVDSITDLLVSHYTVNRETAYEDAAELVQSWLKVGIVEE